VDNVQKVSNCINMLSLRIFRSYKHNWVSSLYKQNSMNLNSQKSETYCPCAQLRHEGVGGEWSASCPCCFTPREKAPGTHWIGGWVDPRAGLDDVEQKLFSVVILSRFMCVTVDGYGLDIGFIDHLYIPLGTILYRSWSRAD
jgi:hypothetical protein